MTGFDIETKSIDGTTCHIVRVKNSSPKKAVLYLFGNVIKLRYLPCCR